MKLGIFALSVAAASANTLFFSEYIESTSYRKALEIYNPTGSDVDGSTVTLQFHANGNDKSGSSSYSEDLAGHTLSAGATFTVCRGGSTGTTFEDDNVAACDVFMSGRRMEFNGNDKIELKVDGATVDVLGDDSGENFGRNKGLRRISTVQTGSTAYDASQWATFDDEDLAGLGSHTVVQPWVGNTLFVSEYIEGSGSLKAFEIFNPSTTDVSASRISYEVVYNGGSSTQGNTLHASYTLPAGGTITVCHSSVSGEVTAACDLYDSKTNFNGNDALKLYVDGALVDVVGVPDSNSWDLKDMTLRRKPSVHTGSLTYDATQWTSLGKDVVDGLQQHAITTYTSIPCGDRCHPIQWPYHMGACYPAATAKQQCADAASAGGYIGFSLQDCYDQPGAGKKFCFKYRDQSANPSSCQTDVFEKTSCTYGTSGGQFFIREGLLNTRFPSLHAKGTQIGEDSFFATGEAPHCFVDPTTGRTVIHTDLSEHTSFSCQHDGGAGTCTCTAHSTAGCKELTHTNGQTIQVSAEGTC